MNKVRTLGLATFAIFGAACSSIPALPKGPDLTGSWIVTTESQMGAQDASMIVKQTGSALAGTMTSQVGSVDYIGSVEGSAVAFGFDIDIRGNSLRID